ncbi:MAG: adenosine deaminase [Opitutaceae bacterium]
MPSSDACQRRKPTSISRGASYRLIQKLEPERFRENPPFWADDFRYPSFEEFEKTLLDHAILWYTSPERYHEAASIIFEGLRNRNVRYVETSFHLGIVEYFDIPGPAIVDAIRSAAPVGMEVRVFAGMLRNNYTPVMKPIIDDLHRWEHLAGVDLHGVEVWDLEAWTAPVWREVRAAGKVTKAHAGEFGGAGNVRQVIEELGVRRVQHGVRSVEDPAVVELLGEVGATLDICPISNLKLGVVPSLREHPIRQLFDAGIRCTVSTDDPFSFGNTLSEEYEALARDLGFTRAELIRIARNGFEVADISEVLRAEAMAELDVLENALA